MVQVIVTEKADRDLGRIIVQLAAEAGERTAQKYDNDFDALYSRLGVFPDSGAPRPWLRPNVRIAAITPFIAIYEHTR